MALEQAVRVPSLNSLQITITKLPTFETRVRNTSNAFFAVTLKMMMLGESERM